MTEEQKLQIERFNLLKDSIGKELVIERTKDLDYYIDKVSRVPTIGFKVVDTLFKLGRKYIELTKELELKKAKQFEKIKWDKNRTYKDNEAEKKLIEDTEIYNLEIEKGIIEEEIKVMEGIKKIVDGLGFQLKNLIELEKLKRG